MSIDSYCYSIGMTEDEYLQFMFNIDETAQAIKAEALKLHKPDTGVYYNVQEILPFISGKTIPEIRAFIIQRLKEIGVEFFDNDTLYRI